MSRHPWTVATAPQVAPSPTLRTPGLVCAHVTQIWEVSQRGLCYLFWHSYKDKEQWSANTVVISFCILSFLS